MRTRLIESFWFVLGIILGLFGLDLVIHYIPESYQAAWLITLLIFLGTAALLRLYETSFLTTAERHRTIHPKEWVTLNLLRGSDLLKFLGIVIILGFLFSSRFWDNDLSSEQTGYLLVILGPLISLWSWKNLI